MSRRTADSNKAIAAAWENEQKRVNEGKGTRDWTPKQQKDILERGKAYDESGRAFQGQHMRSAEAHPECQGDPNNIQFLTRMEHLEAHDGNWKNPTNWHYDPDTKEKLDFGDGPVIPCEVIKLSEPIILIRSAENIDSAADTGAPSKNPKKGKSSGNDPPEAMDRQPIEHNTDASETVLLLNESVKKSKTSAMPKAPVQLHNSGGIGGFFQKAAKGVAKTAKAVGTFCFEHKEAIGAALAFVGTVAKIARDSNGDGSSDNDYDSDYDDLDSEDSSSGGSSDGSNYPDSHESPCEHTVSAHGQHYHTKDGVIWKEKEQYTRGRNNSDE